MTADTASSSNGVTAPECSTIPIPKSYFDKCQFNSMVISEAAVNGVLMVFLEKLEA